MGHLSITKSILIQNVFFAYKWELYCRNSADGVFKQYQKRPLHTKHVPAMCVHTQPVIRPLRYDKAKDVSCVLDKERKYHNMKCICLILHQPWLTWARELTSFCGGERVWFFLFRHGYNFLLLPANMRNNITKIDALWLSTQPHYLPHQNMLYCFERWEITRRSKGYRDYLVQQTLQFPPLFIDGR